MPSNEPDHENRDVQGESSRSDHPRFDGFDLPIDVPLSSRKPRLRHVEYGYHLTYVNVYAQLGLHRYNLLEGTNYKFFRLTSYNMRLNAGAAPYYISLNAVDPDSDAIKPFHALVRENRICRLDISVQIARPQGSTEPPRLCAPTYTCSPLPLWPSSEMIAHRFYMLNEHELRNTDWVQVYLDLAHCTCDRGITESQLCDFDIVQVSIQSLTDEEQPRLDSKSAVVYIVYKDLAKARLGKPSYRRAIIRRLYDESSRSLTLQGKHWSPFEKNKKKRYKKRYALLKKRLGPFRAWRLRLHC